MKIFNHFIPRIIFLIILILALVISSLSLVSVSAATPATPTATVSHASSTTPTAGTSSPPTEGVTASPTEEATISPTEGPTPSPTESPAASPAGSPAVSPIPGATPPEISQYSQDWPLSNQDYSNTRATTNSTINSSNVATLGAAWVHNVPSGLSTFGSISTNPIIMGDTVYIQDMGNNVFALDLATGELKWQTVYNLTNVGPNGVSVAYGKVFMSAGPYDVVALDAATGKEVWRTTLVDINRDPSQGVNGIDMQPTVYDGMVYISTVPGNGGVFYAGGGMGVLYALDQETGKIIWKFNTVYPTDWITNIPGINSGGGAWYSPSVDTATGKMFWGIGNPAPFPGQAKATGIDQDWPNGSSRPGPNLYTSSLLALNHQTGDLSWYYQALPHDISDFDLQAPPILATADYAGKKQDIVIGAGKMGQVCAVNRETGALVWKTAAGEHNGNDLLSSYPTDGTITVLPGILGGVETPMAYADGTIYLIANNLAVDFTNGLTYKLHPLKEATSDMEAIDVNTGKVLWDVKLPSGGFGGATVVNDLVFTGTYDGMLYAFNRSTGQQVWSYQAPAGVNAWPAVVGDTIVWPLAGTGVPSVIGFKLNSTSPAVKIVSPTTGTSIAAGDLAVTAEAVNFNLVDKIGQANTPGEGHLIYYLDTAPPATAGQPATTDSSSPAASSQTTYTWKNVAPGTHTLSVQLVNNDNTPLEKPVVQTVTITADTNPRITIVTPKNGAIMKAGNIAITVKVTNFDLGPGATPSPTPSPSVSPSPSGTLAAAASTPNPNAGAPSPSPAIISPAASPSTAASPAIGAQGKIIYYKDVQAPTAAGQAAVTSEGTFNVTNSITFTWDNVPVGIHTFTVQLVDNNNQPLNPPVTAQVQVYVITYTGGLGSQ